MQKPLAVSQGNLMRKQTFNQINLILVHVLTDLTNSRKDPRLFQEENHQIDFALLNPPLQFHFNLIYLFSFEIQLCLVYFPKVTQQWKGLFHPSKPILFRVFFGFFFSLVAKADYMERNFNKQTSIHCSISVIF